MHSPTATVANLASTVPLVFEQGAEEFCRQRKLLDLVELAAQLASRHYTLAGPIDVEIQTDPDSDEERPLLLAPIISSVEEATRQHSEYIRQWISMVPPERSLLIVLSPTIVGER